MRNFLPRSVLQNENLIVRDQPEGKPFKSGMWGDLNESGIPIPRDGIAYSVGYMPFPDHLEPVGGCKTYSNTGLPVLPGRTGYSLTKAGTTVTKTVGTNFSAADVGNYIIYDDGKHERISAYISVTQVTVEGSAAHAASTAASLRGPVHCLYYHKSQDKILLHIDTRLFVTNTTITSWDQCRCVSYRGLPDSDSVIDEEGEYAIVISATGIFKVRIADTTPLYWKMNSPVPSVLITDVPKVNTLTYGRRYTYAMTRITGTSAVHDRNTSGAVIEHHTGPCIVNNDYRDYGTVYTARPVGDESTTYAVLGGAILSSPGDVVSDYSSLDNAQFRITMNGVSYNCQVNFVGSVSMYDIAARIQSSLRVHVKTAICEYVVNAFRITIPDEGATIGYVAAGDAGTDIGSAMLSLHSGSSAVTNPAFTNKSTIGTLHVPVDLTDSTAEYHHTHYSIFGTLDIGVAGTDPLTGEGNNEELFVWIADIPVAKAFIAARGGATVDASEGTFEPCDVGSKLRFADGTETTIDQYVSSSRVLVTDSGIVLSQAAAIGGDNALSKPIRVMAALQEGTTVTRSDGATFSSDDVGKTIFWASGLRSHIKSYTSANVVEVVEDYTISLTGACLDPKCRKFHDTISDTKLRSRIAGYPLRNRFWEPLPESDMGIIVPGFFFVCTKGQKDLYYCQLPKGYEYFAGYYNPAFQLTNFKDGIKYLSEFPDQLIIYAEHSTHSIPLNTYNRETIPQVGEVVIVIAGQNTTDHSIGARDYGSVCKLDRGLDWVMTNEPGIRIFNGREYSDNLADGRLTKQIEQLQAAIACMYDPYNGVTFFGLDE